MRTGVVGFVAAALLLPVLAQAEATLPAGATQVFLDVATIFVLLLGLGYSLLVTVTGGWVVFDMVTKASKKSAK